MKKVFKHKALAPDEYLGRVDEDGKVYKNIAGPNKPDSYIGRVELNTGKVYDATATAEHYIGRVEVETGKVFLARVGPEEYLGKVNDKGQFFHHKRLARDEYLGKINEMMSYAYGGAAFLLLVYPVFEAELAQAEAEKSADEQK
jgi:hypothetical protein